MYYVTTITSSFVLQEASSSVEGSIEREKLSRKNAFTSELYEYNSHERQVGSSSDDHGPLPDYLSVDHIVSPSNQSSSNSRLYLKENFQNKTNYLCSSKNLLEAAEDTIEELRAEAKMWERNARKLMIDLDISRKESSDLSKKQAELVMELSAENAENDGLKKEVDKLKAELQKLTMNQIAREDSFIQSESLVQIQKVLENEIKYQQDLNDNLAQQLQRSQESNIELLSVLSELEETIEEEKIEIEKLQGDIQLLEEALRDKTNELENERKSNRRILLDVEKDHKHEISVKEEEIASLEATVSGYVKGEHLEVLDEENENNVDLLKEIESLREKVQELERDCTELTDENLELLFKLKDSNKTDIRKCASFDSMSSEHPNVCPSDASEVSDPNFHISHLEEELKKKVGEEEQKTGSESSEHYYTEISKQLDTAFDLLMKPWYDLSSDQNGTRDGFLDGLVTGNKRKSAMSMMSAEYILSFLRELNKQMEVRMTVCGKMIGNHEIEVQERNDVIADAKRKMEESILQVQELEKSMAKTEENYANLMKELDQKRSEIDLLEANLLSKEQENNFLLHRQRELEAEVSELQLEKSHLEQNIELALRERNISTDLENLQNDLTVSSHVSANADLEKSLEMLEREKGELEYTMLGFEEENTQLHECVSGLETQVKQLKDEKEFSLRETDNLKSVAMNLQKLKTEMDIQILDLEQKVEDMQKRWLGAQEECEYLKGENKTLQASAASSVQDCMKLQDSNSELERVNRELQKNCSALVSQLCESKKSLSGCFRKAELLEDRLTLVLDDFAVRENSLRSELDALVKQNIPQKEKLALEESLHQVFMEKTTEFESLQKEVEHLTSQLSDACKERDRISFEASIEVSRLLAEKTELQASLQGVQSELADCKLDKALQESELKVQDLADECESLQKEAEHLTRQLSDARKERDRISFEASDDVSRLLAAQASLQGVRLEAELADSKLQNTLQESELKVQDLANELVASKQSHERLMAEHERILKLLAGYKRSEEKLKTELNDLELKHTISDYERQQLTKEMGILKVQLQSLSVLQDEISVLRRDLNGCRLDKGKLEHALETISGDYEELKAEKISFSEKLSIFQNAMSEVEQCKRNKLALEEKLLQMEKELTAKDILEVQNADLDNELTEIKRANTQFQQKMYRLEEEKDEYLKKAQALEEDLKLMVKRNDIIHKEVILSSYFVEPTLCLNPFCNNILSFSILLAYGFLNV